MLNFFIVGDFLLLVLLGVLVGYLLVLTFAALAAPRRLKQGKLPLPRFVILIPAHDEEQLLPDLLSNLSQLDYPENLYSVHVVADNCTDHTAEIAEQGGAVVHQRFDARVLGKGPALQWLLERIWAQKEPYDALVVLDADTLVSPNFLRVMAYHLQEGDRVVQAYYAVRDPGRSWAISLRYAALAVLHYLRPLGRAVLGGSAGLKGTGMVFAVGVLENHTWSNSLTEDIELHMEVLLAGERVTFAPEAVVWGEMPVSLGKSNTQHTRWERGRLQMARRFVPELVRASFQALRAGKWQRVYLYFDAVMEHIIPPFSILAALSAASFVLSLVLWLLVPASILGRFNFWMSTVILFGQTVYLLVGLKLVEAPKSVYRHLVYAPVLVVWKIWQYGRVLAGKDRQGWVRTVRNEG